MTRIVTVGLVLGLLGVSVARANGPDGEPPRAPRRAPSARPTSRVEAAPRVTAPPPRVRAPRVTEPTPRAPAPRVAAPTPRRPRVRRVPPAPCLHATVELVRIDSVHGHEHRRIALTRCDGTPLPDALDTLTVLARPRTMPRPTLAQIRAHARAVTRRPRRGETRANAAELVPGLLRLDPGLLVRVQQIADRFPGRPIEIVSGYRPDERVGSRHHHARALDLRVRGVSRESLRDHARSFAETGVGYYPNSTFVHVDVRDRRAYWVDRSGPGEEADYGTWPPRGEELAAVEARIANAMAELGALTPSD